MSCKRGRQGTCQEPEPPALWRLDSTRWHRVHPGPLHLIRPLDGDGGPARIIAAADSTAVLMRTPAGSGTTVDPDLGHIQSPGYDPGLWSVPTRTEVDLSQR